MSYYNNYINNLFYFSPINNKFKLYFNLYNKIFSIQTSLKIL